LKIYSIIVCYNPDVSNLFQTYKTLTECNSHVLVIDNTEKSYITVYKNYPDCTFFPLGENTGIAHAQNVGIKYAINLGAEVIILFDQDSKINNNFLSNLLLPLKVDKPCVISPVHFDIDNDYEYPSMKLNKYGLLSKVYKGNKSEPYNVDAVIASGTAVTAVTFGIVGLMDEDYYIDYVDTDWCLRSSSMNIPIQVTPDAVMRHSIGTRSVDFGMMRGYIHNPLRSYYKIRNSFILFRKDYITLLMALKEIITILIHQFVLLFFVKNKTEYIKNYYVAVIHGVKGIVGEKPINR